MNTSRRSDDPAPTPAATRLSDDDLMLLIEQGDADAGLSGLQERYGRRILHFVRGLVRDAHLAQDVTQEVFEKVYLKSHLYQHGTNLRAWLFEVARNQALSALRARRRTPRPISSLSSHADDDDQDLLESIPEIRENRDLEEREFMQAFAKIVDDLPERYRTVFNLFAIEGYPHKDIAEMLGVSENTSKSQFMKARAYLRKLMPKEAVEQYTHGREG